MRGSSDGEWNGVKIFNSQPGKGIFAPINQLRPNMNSGHSDNTAAVLSNSKFFHYLAS